MSWFTFMEVVIGIIVGFFATLSIFVIGHHFVDDVLLNEKKDLFVCAVAVLIWLVITYEVIKWVM